MELELNRNETLALRMRDCFTAGYTLPQYCIDNEIKKPLFVSEKNIFTFAWEVYVQFCYDKRLTAQFCFLDLPSDEIKLALNNTIAPIKFKKFSEVNPSEFDAVILLTNKKVNVAGKAVTFAKLTSYFIRKTQAEIPVLNFLQRYPKVKLFYTILPNKMNRWEGGVEFAKKADAFLSKALESLRKSKGKGKAVATPFDKFGYTGKDVLAFKKAWRSKTNLDGTTFILDNPHHFIEIKNGKRLTAYQPEHFQNRIYFVGPCHFLGRYAPFDRTIESCLQKMLNEHNLPYRVENEGQLFVYRYQDMFYNLNALTPAPGDIIFLWLTNNLRAKNLPFLDLSDVFDPPLDYKEFFFKKGHFNELGYKKIAERFFELLTTNNFFRDVEFNYHTPPPRITDMVYLRNSRRAA